LIDFYRRKAGARGPEILYAFKWPDGRLQRLQNLRFPVEGGKWVRPAWQSPEGWRLGDPPGAWPLYRSESIPSEGAVCVLEGPKCADLAAAIGIHS
jgi:hypothetical protein